MKTIAAEDYQKMCNEYQGWCTECEDFTTGSVEPDAEDYKCESCGSYTVFGAEQSFLLEHFEIEPM